MPVQLAARKSCAVPEAAPPSLASPAKKQMPCVRLGLAPHRKRMGGKGGARPSLRNKQLPHHPHQNQRQLAPVFLPLGFIRCAG